MVVCLWSRLGVAEDSERIRFLNKQSEAIELRYSDSLYSKGCGTLEPAEECEVFPVGDDSHYCWQFAAEGGRNCDPVEDGCSVSPGQTIEVDDSTMHCKLDSDDS